ncbi:hypothetical protein ACOMHN_015004 [Nucella lapillus]
MVSFKQLVDLYVVISLHRRFQCYDSVLGYVENCSARLWHRESDPKSDLGLLFTATSFTIRCQELLPLPPNIELFKLFFTFFPESSTPQQVLNGLWNCSVKTCPSFHHHVACNLKTECADGRDQTEHCPYSSSRQARWLSA